MWCRTDTAQVQAITAKCEESRKCHSFDGFQLLCGAVSPAKFNQILAPIRELMGSSRSKKTLRKLEEVLDHMCTGITHNREVKLEDLLKYIHRSATSAALPSTQSWARTVSENIALSEAPKVKSIADPDAVRPAHLLRLPCYRYHACLCDAAALPKREMEPEVDFNANAHLLVEFGLHILAVCFRQNKARAGVGAGLSPDVRRLT